MDKQYSIVDGMIDWVRVIDKESTVLYANKKMKEDLGEDIVGKKCYEIFCKNINCEYCLSHGTLANGDINKKKESLNGRTYMIVSSPMLDKEEGIIGSVEVFRDITNEKILSKEVNEKNRKMIADIGFARNMQSRMLPPKGMYNGVNIDYLYRSSEFLSGDYFDVFNIDNENTGIYICDVVGHGVSASLLTIFVRQSLRSLAKNVKVPDKVMKELHKAFLTLNLDYDKYISLFFGIYNKKTREFQYVNAGHNSIPLLLRNKDVILLESKGYPICNIFDYVEYDVSFIKLFEGDKLFLYTDGITESRNEIEEEFGIEKLINLIKTDGNILEAIKSSILEHSKVQKDDYALLMTEII